MARIKLDENLPEEAARFLRNAGHDAATIREQRMGGSYDPIVAKVCREEKRALLTLDTDFADIRAYPPREYPGIVVLRLRLQDKPNVLGVIQRLIPLLSAEPISGRLWIVDESRVRVRE